jgi:hypothetical protein
MGIDIGSAQLARVATDALMGVGHHDAGHAMLHASHLVKAAFSLTLTQLATLPSNTHAHSPATPQPQQTQTPNSHPRPPTLFHSTPHAHINDTKTKQLHQHRVAWVSTRAGHLHRAPGQRLASRHRRCSLQGRQDRVPVVAHWPRLAQIVGGTSALQGSRRRVAARRLSVCDCHPRSKSASAQEVQREAS